jgi:hypothetical protein
MFASDFFWFRKLALVMYLFTDLSGATALVWVTLLWASELGVTVSLTPWQKKKKNAEKK